MRSEEIRVGHERLLLFLDQYGTSLDRFLYSTPKVYCKDCCLSALYPPQPFFSKPLRLRRMRIVFYYIFVVEMSMPYRIFLIRLLL